MQSFDDSRSLASSPPFQTAVSISEDEELEEQEDTFPNNPIYSSLIVGKFKNLKSINEFI